jgi:hypothetical protein
MDCVSFISRGFDRKWIRLLAVLLVLILGLASSMPVQAHAPAQAGGYWKFLKVTDTPDEHVTDDRTIIKNTISQSGGYFYHKNIGPDGVNFWIQEFTCSWSITSPANLDKLYPGDKLEATASCTDTSQLSNENTGATGGGMKFALEPEGIKAYDAEMVAFSLGVGYKESKSLSGSVVVPEGPLGRDWGNRLAVSYTMAWTGLTQRIYEWTPITTETQAPAAAAVPPPAAGGACTATLKPSLEPAVGQELHFTATVVNQAGAAVTPEQEEWLYNEVGSTNSNMQWDGKEATVDYIYTCPEDHQRYQVRYTLPAQADNSGWIVKVGGLGLGAAAAAAAALAGAGLLVTGAKAGGKAGGKNAQNLPRYLLQVDKRSLELHPGESAVLNAQAWRIDPNGAPPTPATNASLQVSVPPSPTGLTAAPGSGMCALTCVFSAPHPSACEPVPVTLSADAEGMHISTQVTVNVLPRYDLTLQWQDPAKKPQPGGQPAWAFAALKCAPPDPRLTPDQLSAQIAFTVVGPNSAQVHLAPAQVQNGLAWVQVSLDAAAPGQPSQPGSPSLAASFTSGSQRLEQRLDVSLGDELILDAWINGKKEEAAYYIRNQDQPDWEFAEIGAYFHAQGNDRPVKPTFRYRLDASSVTCDPPVLEVKEFTRRETEIDQYTLKLRLIPGTNLEQYFGEDLTDRDGRITVTLKAVDENGKTYPVSVKYLLKINVTFVVVSHDGHLTKFGGRDYSKISLEPYELVADGKDALPLAGFFIRTDQDSKSPDILSKRLDIGEVSGMHWKNGQDETDFGLPQPDADNEGDGLCAYTLQPARPIPFSYSRSNAVHSLTFEVKLTDTGSRYQLETNKTEIQVKAQYPELSVWVVPGEYRHTSLALAFVQVLPACQPLIGADLSLSVESPAKADFSSDTLFGDVSTARLDLDKDSPSQQQSIEFVSGKVNSDLTDGSAVWTLRYSSLNWGNLPSTRFKVTCSHLDGHGAPAYSISQDIDVCQNVNDMLAALVDDPGMKTKLNNPYFDASLNPGAESILPDVRGPYWNIRQKFDDSAPYVCYRMRNDIIEFLLNRSRVHNGGDVTASVKRMASMNGIEFDYYAMRPVHVYAGFFLSGCGRYDDYRVLDPWWRQSWPAEMKELRNLMNKYEEKMQAEKIAAEKFSIAPQALIDLANRGISSAAQTFENWYRGLPVGGAILPDSKTGTLPVTLKGEPGAEVLNEVFTSDSNLVGADGQITGAKISWFRELVDATRQHAKARLGVK